MTKRFKVVLASNGNLAYDTDDLEDAFKTLQDQELMTMVPHVLKVGDRRLYLDGLCDTENKEYDKVHQGLLMNAYLYWLRRQDNETLA